MAKPTVINLPLDRIENKFDVRRSLNDDRILQLAEAYQSGADLPPIQVIRTGDNQYAFIDGRHRAQARKLLDLKDVPCIIQSPGKRHIELLAEALAANWGGALPPSRDDISHTVLRMLESGAKDKDVRELLNFLPMSSMRTYLANARSTLGMRAKRKALDLIADGTSIADAARATGIDADMVRDLIAGRKRKWGKDNSASILAEFKRYLTRNTRGPNSGIGQKLEHLIQQVEDGEVAPSTVESSINAWENNVKSTMHRIQDWRERLAAAGGSNGNGNA